MPDLPLLYVLFRIESGDPTLLSVECSQFRFGLFPGSWRKKYGVRNQDKTRIRKWWASVCLHGIRVYCIAWSFGRGLPSYFTLNLSSRGTNKGYMALTRLRSLPLWSASCHKGIWFNYSDFLYGKVSFSWQNLNLRSTEPTVALVKSWLIPHKKRFQGGLKRGLRRVTRFSNRIRSNRKRTAPAFSKIEYLYLFQL